MSQFQAWRSHVADYVRQDFQAYPLRFCLEMLGWVISICCSLTYAITVPNLPFIPLYCAFISGCMIMAWCAWTRGSFGILGNYMILCVIDSTGLIKLILQRYS